MLEAVVVLEVVVDVAVEVVEVVVVALTEVDVVLVVAVATTHWSEKSVQPYQLIASN